MSMIQVRKYGGSSVADSNKIRTIVSSLLPIVNKGNKILVVVSAMGKTTDILFSQGKKHFQDNNCKKELALYVSTGEIQSASLFSMECKKQSIKSTVLMPASIPLNTTDDFLDSNITEISKDKILELFDYNDVIVVPGYQGINSDEDITLLGRGGSDTSAVALAAALELDECYIFSDVDGIYTCDPSVVKESQKIENISYDIMREMSVNGAGVLHYRAVEIARKYHIDVKCYSTFENKEGSIVGKLSSIEENGLCSIVYDVNKSYVSLTGVKDVNNALEVIYEIIEELQISIDMLNQSGDNIFIIVSKTAVLSLINLIGERKEKIIYDNLNYNIDIVKISLIEKDLNNNTSIVKKVLNILKENNKKMLVIETTDLKISFIVQADDFEKLIKDLHKDFF